MNTTPSLEHFLKPIKPILAEEGVTELCINRPGEVFIETNMGWSRREMSELTYEWADVFATTLANSTMRWVDGQKSLLSTSTPTGERVNIVYPPSCEPGTIAITIRRPSPKRITHAELVKGGIYREVKRSLEALDPFEEELLALHRAGDYEAFMPLAIKEKRNTVAHATGRPTGRSTRTSAGSAVVIRCSFRPQPVTSTFGFRVPGAPP
jgi:type IV secretion system protein VirB11